MYQRIPLKSAIFANPIIVHPKYGAQLSLFHGLQPNQKCFLVELLYLPELQLIETRVKDETRDQDWDIRYVNMANTKQFVPLDGAIQSKQKYEVTSGSKARSRKQADNEGDRVQDSRCKTSTVQPTIDN